MQNFWWCIDIFRWPIVVKVIWVKISEYPGLETLQEIQKMRRILLVKGQQDMIKKFQVLSLDLEPSKIDHA